MMENEDRLISSAAGLDESSVEGALRPKDLQEFIGQERVRQQIDVLLTAWNYCRSYFTERSTWTWKDNSGTYLGR